MTYRPLQTARPAVLAFIAIASFACTDLPTASTDQTPAVRHVDVYFEKGMFGGWPANHGIWSWGDEILVGFSKGY